MNTSSTPGIHHITAIAGSARENLRFYRDLLGLRFIKKTVNFDDPTTYHLYYGDEAGTPGTILTFFPWETTRRGTPGAGQIIATAFLIDPASLPFWEARHADAGLETRRITRFGEELLQFVDPDGMMLELVASEVAAQSPGWAGGPVPSEHALRGFHSATALYRYAGDSLPLLLGPLGMQESAREGARTRYRMAGSDKPGVYFDVLEDPSAERGRQGSGTVHHIAFRAPNREAQAALRSHLAAASVDVTPIIDRTYFHSIYFREPGGVLLEVATDLPGFTVDEPIEALGTSLRLPPQHEPHRTEIERALPPLGPDSISDSLRRSSAP